MNKQIIEEALRRDPARTRGPGLKTRKLESAPAGPSIQESSYYYRFLTESEVAGDKVRAAIAMLELCQRKLRVKTIHLGWFGPCDSRAPGVTFLGRRRMRGFVEFGAVPTIWLRADLLLMDLQLAAAHEAHHIWMEAQPKDRYASLNAADRENCADAFSWIMWKDLRDRS